MDDEDPRPELTELSGSLRRPDAIDRNEDDKVFSELRKSLRALYLEVPKSIARDVQNRAIAAIDRLASENAAMRQIVGEAINKDEHARNWYKAADWIGDPEPVVERYIVARRIMETPQVKRLAESHAPVCTCELCHAWRERERIEIDIEGREQGK